MCWDIQHIQLFERVQRSVRSSPRLVCVSWPACFRERRVMSSFQRPRSRLHGEKTTPWSLCFDHSLEPSFTNCGEKSCGSACNGEYGGCEASRVSPRVCVGVGENSEGSRITRWSLQCGEYSIDLSPSLLSLTLDDKSSLVTLNY
jgi:hypothetical protein